MIMVIRDMLNAEKNNKSGFTLVELAIVITIVGLIAGGLLAARSIIDATRVSSQIKQLQQYDVAVASFRASYKQIPGDSNLGFYNSDAPVSMLQTAAPIRVFARNIGYLEDLNMDSPPRELRGAPMIFFTHLHHSGVLTEEHNASLDWCRGKGEEWPDAAIGSGGILVQGNRKGEIFWILGGLVHSKCSTQHYTHNLSNSYGIPSPYALAIDTKLDDGMPLTGNVVSISRNVDNDGSPYPMQLNNATGPSNCADTGPSASRVYNMDAITNTCKLLIKSKYK